MLTSAPVLALILLIGVAIATVRDLRIREVPDTVSYGLIAVGILTGLIAAIAQASLTPLLSSLAGFATGALIGLALYFLRQWGGGDTKLLMGVGAVIGLTTTDLTLIAYVILLILFGAIYGFLYTLWLAILHRKRFVPAFIARLRTPTVHRVRITMVVTCVILLILIFFVPLDAKVMLGFVMVALYLLTYCWIAVRVIETTLMTKEYPVAKLTEGDWLVEDVRVKGKTLASKGGTGLTLEEIAAIRKAKVKAVKVREGVPFVPAFLLALLALLLFEWRFGDVTAAVTSFL